jgi:hypothetical protein
MNPQRTDSNRRRGHAALEFALLSPWIFYLFFGTLDLGFYSYALISTQNSARVAAQYTSKVPGKLEDEAGACAYVLAELSGMGNLHNLSSCTALPLIVHVNAVKDFDGADASSVSVTYQTAPLIPIPGLRGRLTVTRVVQMRIL